MNIYIKTKKNNYLFLLFGLAHVVAVGVLILIVGIIMLVLWKWFALKKEKLEYIKFINEKERSKWDAVSAFILISHMQKERETDMHPHTHSTPYTHTRMHTHRESLSFSVTLTLSEILTLSLSFSHDTGIILCKIF
jgi:ABC-type nickel/cobalt efflux system permease component RcnA